MQPDDQGSAARKDLSLHARHNIALFHRDHMRFNATLLLEVAADLSREANRLKVFGDYWQRAEEPPATPAFDTSDRRFGGAGCGDLSPRSAVANAGILFMEAQGEPDEIRVLKEKLRTRGEGFMNKGRWLTETMTRSWQRDQVLLDPATPDAWPWVGVVSITWRGAKQRSMAGKLLLVALEYLEKIEFTPAAIRRNRAASGKLMVAAGRAMDAAAALFCKNAESLTHDDPEMAEYLAFFENPQRR
ncbi:MAG: hypothetical protein IT513_01045 [Burkholderiales bacterium]|nr:hypothetical protein [Burkholderiales bacterium]